jgi:hypothetical protein
MWEFYCRKPIAGFLYQLEMASEPPFHRRFFGAFSPFCPRRHLFRRFPTTSFCSSILRIPSGVRVRKLVGSLLRSLTGISGFPGTMPKQSVKVPPRSKGADLTAKTLENHNMKFAYGYMVSNVPVRTACDKYTDLVHLYASAR